MLTTTDAVRNIVKKSPFIQEMLRQEWLNLSKYALSIQPIVEEILWKKVQTGSIITALARLRNEIKGTFDIKIKVNDIALKFPITEVNFAKENTHQDKIGKLYQSLPALENQFLNIISGNSETSIFVNSNYVDTVLKIFQPQKPNFNHDNLGAVSVKFDPQYAQTQGAVYQILKLLVWDNINLTELISTYTELTLVVKKEKCQQVFDILSEGLL